ncbi:MAG TPA: hypothetical protein ENJ54_12080 [Chloroflexi bacterium]|nr:hypothetical protein [Chloroflexota bacterium]
MFGRHDLLDLLQHGFHFLRRGGVAGAEGLEELPEGEEFGSLFSGDVLRGTVQFPRAHQQNDGFGGVGLRGHVRGLVGGFSRFVRGRTGRKPQRKHAEQGEDAK